MFDATLRGLRRCHCFTTTARKPYDHNAPVHSYIRTPIEHAVTDALQTKYLRSSWIVISLRIQQSTKCDSHTVVIIRYVKYWLIYLRPCMVAHSTTSSSVAWWRPGDGSGDFRPPVCWTPRRTAVASFWRRDRRNSPNTVRGSQSTSTCYSSWRYPVLLTQCLFDYLLSSSRVVSGRHVMMQVHGNTAASTIFTQSW